MIRPRRWAALLAVLLVSGCIVKSPRVEKRDPETTQSVRSPVKAHLLSGEVIMFEDGVRVRADTLFGRGKRWDLDRRRSVDVTHVPTDSVAALEAYDERTDVFATGLATFPPIIGGALLLKIAFGSCPTFYTETPDGRQLEAEGFSSSIARRFEADDLDLLKHATEQKGRVRLHVANEALETHYINQLALVAVDHPAGTRVIPSADGKVMVLGAAAPSLGAR